MKFLTDELLKSSPFVYDELAKEPGGAFYEALLEEIKFNYDNNELYKKFCMNKGFNPHDFHGSIAEIPPVQVSVFKELGRELKSVSDESIKLTLQSSATSGVPSSIPVDLITSKRQARAMIRVIGNFIGNERKPFIIMDVDPAEGFMKILGARYAAVSGYLNFASEAGYFLKVNSDGTYYFDTEGMQNFIAGLNGQCCVVFGFTYILYSEVIKPLTQKGIKFSLPEGSKVIHIGGWKKLEDEKISRKEFNMLASKLFDVNEEDIIDIYGFTEQMGLNYPDCPCGCKHAPLYSDVIVRDIITKEILPPGSEGLLEFVSPVPHSYPGNVVLTDDVGVIVEGSCKFKRSGKRFRVTGRLKKAEIRGCGDILSDKLKFRSSQHNELNEAKPFSISYSQEISTQLSSSSEAIQEIGRLLMENLAWLRRQPINALIGLIAKVARKWPKKLSSLNDTQNQGLNFLVSWCSPENLTRIADYGLRGNRDYSDKFIPVDDNGLHFMHSASRGLVCHWLAGNVQVLGMFVLIQSILTKNVNLLRVSSRDNGTLELMLSCFRNESYTTPGGYLISGDDLLKTIAIASFHHSDNKAHKKMSELADVRIAWGGREAVSAVSAFPSKYDCEDIIMGPKLSMSVIACEAISDERKARKLARKISVDASVFDQTGCASTHNVFVERGSKITPAEFAEYLAEAMKKTSLQIPKGKMTPEEFAAVHSARGIFDFKGKVFGDDSSIWTILYSDEPELNKPVYSRVVFVHAVESIYDVLKFIHNETQTIGLAAPQDKALKFAASASELGAVRFPVCGKMLNFDSPWDGMFIMDRLVKWITLGGPIL